MDDVTRQRDYYARTAADYEATHLGSFDEHMLALALFAGVARSLGGASVLDVGAGTGRALRYLADQLPEASLVGIEPVAALREVGHANGLDRNMLIAGSGEDLPFADDSFDFVIETGMLHHVARPDRVVAEMARVARIGVLISDSNKFGQGSHGLRLAKALVDRLGLWRAMIWVTTRGRMAKWSEGDGLYYSYSVFDDLGLLAAKFPRLHLANTLPMTGGNLRRGAGHLCAIALVSDVPRTV